MNYCETHTIFKPHMTPAALAMLKGLSSGLTGALAFVTKHAELFKPVIVKVLPKLTPFGGALLGSSSPSS